MKNYKLLFLLNMKTESMYIDGKMKFNKITKIDNKISKTIQIKPNHSSMKQKNIIIPNFKKEENNNSNIMNKKNWKQNKFNINKKLNIINENKENQNIYKISENKRMNNHKNLIYGNSTSYIIEESKKTGNINLEKNDYNKSLLVKKYSLQNNSKISDKLMESTKHYQSKSINKDSALYFQKNKEKEKELYKNIQLSDLKKKDKQKLTNNNLEILKKTKLKMLNDRFNLKKNNLNNNDDIFIYDENKPIILTKEEQTIYGDRAMKGYHKIKLLGKGGYGIVWECINNSNKENNDLSTYAVKQTSKKNLISYTKEDILRIAKNEINILKKLNEDDIKCDLIPKIYESNEDSNDIWFSFDKGGVSLSSLCFNIKGIFEKGERIYQIQKGDFLIKLFKNINQFKYLIKKILEGIDYINKKGIIHSDIKPENLLVTFNKNEDFEIKSVKIVDYGSAFYSNSKSPLITNTPEYLCPEIITNDKEFIKKINNNNYLNSIDIWSFGISLLELCLCCPIWMSYKAKIMINGKIIYNMGYFGCKGRDENKIYQKQLDLNKNLHKILKNSMIYMFDEINKNNFIDLLGKMLYFDYTKRITIEEALKHPFLNNI